MYSTTQNQIKIIHYQYRAISINTVLKFQLLLGISQHCLLLINFIKFSVSKLLLRYSHSHITPIFQEASFSLLKILISLSTLSLNFFNQNCVLDLGFVDNLQLKNHKTKELFNTLNKFKFSSGASWCMLCI